MDTFFNAPNNYIQFKTVASDPGEREGNLIQILVPKVIGQCGGR